MPFTTVLLQAFLVLASMFFRVLQVKEMHEKTFEACVSERDASAQLPGVHLRIVLQL